MTAIPTLTKEHLIYTMSPKNQPVMHVHSQMVRFLEIECNMDTTEATFLLSATGNLRICQVVDPLQTARFELPRWIAETEGVSFPY